MFKNKLTGRTLTQDLKQIARDLEKLHNKELPEEAESKLGEIVTESFRQEKYVGSLKSGKWSRRKGEKRVKQRQRRNLLVKDSSLIGSVTPFSNKRAAGVRIVDNGGNPSVLKYAAVHNEGLKSGRGKGFKMPKRQYMPIPGQPVPKLQKHLFKYLDKRGNQIFNKR